MVDIITDSAFQLQSIAQQLKMNCHWHLVRSTSIFISLTAVLGCAAPTKFVYRSGTDESEKISYISKDNPSFKFDIPDIYWKVVKNQPNLIALQSTRGPRRLVSILEYDEGIVRKKFYKEDFTEEQALEEYYRSEAEYHFSKSANLQRRIITKNVSGPVLPNLLWFLKGPDSQILVITMSKDRHFIAISVQEFEPPFTGEHLVLEMFRSIKLLTKDQANSILETETSYR